MNEYNPKKEPTGKDINKKSGSTTLKRCGWCKHTSGTHRYSYCIEGSCALQKSYTNKVKWSDKCFFIDASETDIKAVIKSHKRSIKTAKSSIKTHEDYILILIKLLEKSSWRPPLPDDREYDHFKIDQPIKVYFDSKWHSGFVCSGYRHHDGCVSYILNDRSGTPGCGVAVPIVMLKKEYDFFKSNIKEYKKWCSIAYNKTFNGNKLEVAIIN